MRFKAFNSRYRLLAPFTQLRRSEEGAIEDCQLILHRLEEKQQLKQLQSEVSVSWAFGKRHIFLRYSIDAQDFHIIFLGWGLYFTRKYTVIITLWKEKVIKIPLNNLYQ